MCCALWTWIPSTRFDNKHNNVLCRNLNFIKSGNVLKKTVHKFRGKWKKSKKTGKYNEMNSFGKKKFLRINNRAEHIFWQMKTYCFLKLVEGLASWNNTVLSSGVLSSCCRKFLAWNPSKGLTDAQTLITISNVKLENSKKILQKSWDDIFNIWPFLTSS